MLNFRVQVEKHISEDEMYYNNVLVLSYKIEYPQFYGAMFSMALNRLNHYYRQQALAYEGYCRGEFYKQAVEEYKNAVENGYPVRAFDTVQTYTITYNENCTLSLYFEQYQYTGGAHGMTIRFSDTWNLQSCCKIALGHMFSRFINYKDYIIKNITDQIAEQIAKGNDIYFDNYQENVANYFDPNNFYLTREGGVIYYQLYEIAPYSSGIPEFTIPYYPKGMALQPKCLMHPMGR